MRPVNLIPPEQRRGERAPARTGPLPYILVGGLAAVLAGMTLMVLTGNKVEERAAEVDSLAAQKLSLQATAESLRPYSDFATLAQAREATVTSLADSRFDWERVLRELALVFPDDAWLTGVTGTVSSDVQLQGGTGVDGRDVVAGPALELTGCAASHEAVAGFLAALRDIDGVTRVGMKSSERSETTADTSVGTGTAGSDCRTRSAIAKFEVIVAFDAVPPPVAPAVATPLPGAAPASDATAAAPPAETQAATPTSEVAQ